LNKIPERCHKQITSEQITLIVFKLWLLWGHKSAKGVLYSSPGFTVNKFKSKENKFKPELYIKSLLLTLRLRRYVLNELVHHLGNLI